MKPRKTQLEMLEAWLGTTIILILLTPLIREMVKAEAIAPGYGADATVMRWMVMVHDSARTGRASDG